MFIDFHFQTHPVQQLRPGFIPPSAITSLGLQALETQTAIQNKVATDFVVTEIFDPSIEKL